MTASGRFATARDRLVDLSARNVSAAICSNKRRQLQAALAEPHGDRHRLRLLIKRLRYSNEVYGACSTVSVPCMDALKAAQAALGDWHDLDQWCQRAAREVDLQPLQAAWQLQASTALAAAEQPLQVLTKRLAELP